MTQKENWEERFYEKFEFIDDFSESTNRRDKVKDFIQGLLVAQKDSFRKEMEDPSCSCHKPTEAGWREKAEELLKDFSHLVYYEGDPKRTNGTNHGDIIAFIEHEKQLSFEEGYAKCYEGYKDMSPFEAGRKKGIEEVRNQVIPKLEQILKEGDGDIAYSRTKHLLSALTTPPSGKEV